MHKITDQLKRHEGLRLKPYRCTANKLTIGYGRNIEDCGINQAEAEEMLRTDIMSVNLKLTSQYPKYCNLDSARQGVLVNMCFNLGLAGLMKFQKMQAAVLAGDFNRAADEMLDSRWAGQVGNRADELAIQMRTGEWQ